MTWKVTGGTAFPVQDEETYSYGMTLRDYFAAKAMPYVCDMLAKSGNYTADSFPPAVAMGAYKIADAMIKESQK